MTTGQGPAGMGRERMRDDQFDQAALPPPRPPRRGGGLGGCGVATIMLGMLLGGVVTLVATLIFGRGLIAPPAAAPQPTRPPLVIFPTSAPSPTPTIITGPEIVQRIQQVSQLQTTTYSVQSVVTIERPGNVIGIGRQRLLVIVHGTVVAGVDLGTLRAQDVRVSVDGKQVTVRAPEVEILSHYLDVGRTQLYDHQTGLFTRPDTNLVLEAERAGADQILRAACADGIMGRASEDSRQALHQLLSLMGFERVIFEEQAVPACPEPASAPPVTATPGTPIAAPGTTPTTRP